MIKSIKSINLVHFRYLLKKYDMIQAIATVENEKKRKMKRKK